MTREQAKRWQPEIIYWANDGNLWWYDKSKWIKYDENKNLSFQELNILYYVIEDEHFEARKAFALGEPIEYSISNSWRKCEKPLFAENIKYRPKPKEWYNEVSEDNPILCWVKGNRGKILPAMVYKYEDELFYDTDSYRWVYAEPIKPEECWKEK